MVYKEANDMDKITYKEHQNDMDVMRERIIKAESVAKLALQLAVISLGLAFAVFCILIQTY